MTSSVTPTRFIGCDVGKRSITVFDSQTQRSFVVANTASALRTFAKRLDACCLVICEATGGYEARLLASLVAAKVPAHRAGTLGKSDKIDAKGLSRYGAERQTRLVRWQARDESRISLQTLVLTRNDLVKSRTAFQNRLAAPQSQAARPHLKAVSAKLNAEIAKIEAKIGELERNSQPLRQALEILTGIVSIGATTASALLALMPELGTLNRRQVASLGGLAPHPNQSGEQERYRRTRGGRSAVKDALFMAALSASRYHPTLSLLYQRLIQRGKKQIVALAAVRRKLLVIANAKLRDAMAV